MKPTTTKQLMQRRAFLMDRLLREIAITYGYPTSNDQLPSSVKTILADAAEMMIDDWGHYDFHQSGVSDWPIPATIDEICRIDTLIYKQNVPSHPSVPRA